MQIEFKSLTLPSHGTIALGVYDDLSLTAKGQDLNQQSKEALTKALSLSGFKGKAESAALLVSVAGLPFDRIIVLGLGKKGDKKKASQWARLGGCVTQICYAHKIDSVQVILDEVENPECAVEFALGAKLRHYRFDKYLTQQKPEDKSNIVYVACHVANPEKCQKAWEQKNSIIDAVFFTRDMVTEPANIIYPKSLAKKAQEMSNLGLNVKILGNDEMKALGMGALLGVAQGSEHEPQLVAIEWRGGKADQQPIAFVGKGVTFDSGGISIKPGDGMEDMKWDMAGSAVVLGLMQALAARKAKVNVVGVVALVENMPSGTAQRPGDVVRSYSGQTIEVLNTDAEGRLILADALWYVQEQFKPSTIVDLATLTGAMIISLGYEYAGVFANDKKIADQLIEAGQEVGEKMWHLPLDEAYNKEMNSDIADMKNISGTRAAGSITAAQFLQRFIKDGTKWAHIDIAGVSWTKKDSPIYPKGATAFGVRALDQFVEKFYESN